MTNLIQNSVSKRAMVEYSFLALPLAFAGLPFYIFIPDYYTREMDLSLASAGFILIFLRIVDAIQDPLIGYISDKSQNLQIFLICMGFVSLAAGMGALMLGPPAFVPVEHWFGIMVALTAFGLSATSINFVMLGSLWKDNEAFRQIISAFRESFGLLGMLLASTLPVLLMGYFDKDTATKLFLAVFLSLLALGALCFYKFFQNNIFRASPSECRSIRIPFSFIKNNNGFFLACFLTHLAASLPACLFLYFVQDFLQAVENAGLFLLLYFLSGSVFMPFWLRLARSCSAEYAWLVSTIVALTTFIWAYTLSPASHLQFGIICILSGSALGADLALPPAILARRISEQTAEIFAGQAYAILNIIPKMAFAFATGGAFVALDMVGFLPSGDNDQSALGMLSVLYALAPCLLKAASGIVIYTMIRGEKHETQERNTLHEPTYGA